jgi:hypothetical protein
MKKIINPWRNHEVLTEGEHYDYLTRITKKEQ